MDIDNNELAGLSKQERKKLRLKLKREAEEKERNKLMRARRIRKSLILGSFFIILLLLGFFVYSKATSPGPYDSFAKCLSEKAVVYGNDGCPYTAAQLAWFGKSSKYLNYVRCSLNKQLCAEKSIKITPTWEINGKLYPGVQSLEKISSLSGCEIEG
jgi:polyferredoxin